MATETDDTSARSTDRAPLSRERVARAAVGLADREGLSAVTMRAVGAELGVEAMSLYNHVTNKEDLLDAMVDEVVSRADPSVVEAVPAEAPWTDRVRTMSLAAREVMRAHPWAPDVIESRSTLSPSLFSWMDRLIGVMRDGGLSLDLVHHSLHALGSRALGFTQELFEEDDDNPQPSNEDLQAQFADAFPNLVAMLAVVTHEDDAIRGCDDQFEFEFGLDVLLDGIEARRRAQP